jgi:hypothetical protein
MPIAKRPQNASKAQPDDAAAEAFIAGAGQPPSPAAPPRPRKERVMTQFDAEVLAGVDKAAKRRGISRSAWIQFVVSRALDQGEG